MKKGYEIAGQTIVDPEKVKYYLNKHRWVITRQINGKQWRRSHLVYAWHYHLTLETMKLLFDLNYLIHHKDKNPQNDDIENLELIKRGKHQTLHQKGANSSLYRHDVKIEQVIDLVVRQGFSTHKAAKFFKVDHATVQNRLYKAGYTFQYPIWAEEINYDDKRV